jgi:transcriptional regulator with XRE-family HTH domain
MECAVAEVKVPGELLVSGLVRKARRLADMSQREMARAAEVSQAAISKIEAGTLMPSMGLLQRVLGVAKLWLVAVDDEGRVVEPMKDWQDTRDGAGRRYPSHLDTILDPKPGDWWGDVYGLTAPPETFRRDRGVRDMQRKRSQWEVRVAKFRNVPPPPDPFAVERRQMFLLGYERGSSARAFRFRPRRAGEPGWDGAAARPGGRAAAVTAGTALAGAG